MAQLDSDVITDFVVHVEMQAEDFISLKIMEEAGRYANGDFHKAMAMMDTLQDFFAGATRFNLAMADEMEMNDE